MSISFDDLFGFSDIELKPTTDSKNPEINLQPEPKEPNGSSFREILKLYFNIFAHSFVLSLPVIAFITLIYLLPWANDLNNYNNYYNVIVVAAVLYLSLISFGPWYISYYTYLINGDIKKFDRKYIIHVIIQTIFWPVFFTILIYYKIYPWFYYLDFMFFVFGFLPIVAHVAYCYIMKGDERAVRSTIRFVISELIVIIGALSYTFFLFPFYVKLSDGNKIIWRLTLHPLWFELMLLAQRVLASLDVTEENKYKRFFLALHSIFHYVTIGRMVLFSVNDPYMCLLMITLSNIQEIVGRLTVVWRDERIYKMFMTCKRIFGLGKNDIDEFKWDIETYGCIINMEMLLELISIFMSPFMMGLFMKYEYMFSFNGVAAHAGSITVASIFLNFVYQLLTEILTDVLCMNFEMKIHKINLAKTWKNIGTKKILLFCIYGMCTMGSLGMIYTTLILPRAAFCKENNILTCTYAPVY